MASITVTLTGICAGGNHLTFIVTSGEQQRSVGLTVDAISDAVKDAELESVIIVLAKLVRSGRTLAQARTILQTGVVIGQ